MASALFAKLQTTNVVQTKGPWDKLELPIKFRAIERTEDRITCDVTCLGVKMAQWELGPKGLASDTRDAFKMFQDEAIGVKGTYSVKGLAKSSLYLLSDLLAIGVHVQRNGQIKSDPKAKFRMTIDDGVAIKLSPKIVWGTFEAMTQAAVVVIKMIGNLHFAMRVEDKAATIMVLKDVPFGPDGENASPATIWSKCKERCIHQRVLGTVNGERVWKSIQ